jgi:murein DD-endopeptidase MepM/ murein hydrolase activator NlpD
MKIQTGITWFFLLSLVACTQQPQSVPLQVATSSPVPQPAQSNPTQIGQSITPTPDPIEVLPAYSQVVPKTLPTSASGETLPETIFSNSSEEDSNWRPPLYPTPWIPTDYDHFYFCRPIAAEDLRWILANYRYGGVFIRGVVHTGIDIPVLIGTKVYAAGPGRVTWVGYGLLAGKYDPDDPYGLAIVIRHDFGYQGQTLYTVYGHLSKVYVIRGQQVDTGDKIGLSGATGNVTGPHVHFEVRIGRNSFSRSRNPELWLSPAMGWGILAGRMTNVFGDLLLNRVVWIKSVSSGRKWYVESYGGGATNSDPYYKENMVIGDLPAGSYSIWIPSETSLHANIDILPGRVSYFNFQKGPGFTVAPPAEPSSGFNTPLPPEPTATP